MIDRIRRNLSDFIDLFLIPISISLLPWSLGFKAIRIWARHDQSHKEAVDDAWRAAAQHGVESDEKEWRWRFRLLRLQERVDVWLVLTRSAAWWRRRVVQKGRWPTSGPCVLLTYHWGGAHWIWGSLREQHLPAHFIARRVEVADLGTGRIALWFARMRGIGMCRSGGRGPLFIGGSASKIRHALHAGSSVVGMLDLPASSAQQSMQRSLMYGDVCFPTGLARLAVAACVPVCIFSCGLDKDTGQRDLWVETLPAGSDVEAIMSRYFRHLDERLANESAYWQLWALAPRMFVQGTVKSLASIPSGRPNSPRSD